MGAICDGDGVIATGWCVINGSDGGGDDNTVDGGAAGAGASGNGGGAAGAGASGNDGDNFVGYAPYQSM